MDRDLYRGYFVRAFAEEGVPCVGVREQGKYVWAEKFVGVGDRQVGKDWVDEQLDGVKKQRQAPDFFKALEAMAGDYEERIEIEVNGRLKAEARVQELEAAQRAEKVQGECPFAVMLMKPTKDRKAINAQFRRLSKACHPDSGGDAEIFRRLSEAKERCLAWAARQCSS